MSNLRQAAQQALEALEKATRFMSDSDYKKLNEAIDALRAALGEPEQPVAWLRADGMKSMPNDEKEAWLATGRAFDQEIVEDYTVPLYTAPTPRRPLTDDALHQVIRAGNYDSMEQFARAIERHHGIGEQT